MKTIFTFEQEFKDADSIGFFDWRIDEAPDLAGLTAGSEEEADALDEILSAFLVRNDTELSWQARVQWVTVAREVFNSESTYWLRHPSDSRYAMKTTRGKAKQILKDRGWGEEL